MSSGDPQKADGKLTSMIFDPHLILIWSSCLAALFHLYSRVENLVPGEFPIVHPCSESTEQHTVPEPTFTLFTHSHFIEAFSCLAGEIKPANNPHGQRWSWDIHRSTTISCRLGHQLRRNQTHDQDLFPFPAPGTAGLQDCRGKNNFLGTTRNHAQIYISSNFWGPKTGTELSLVALVRTMLWSLPYCMPYFDILCLFGEKSIDLAIPLPSPSAWQGPPFEKGSTESCLLRIHAWKSGSLWACGTRSPDRKSVV